MPTDTPAILAPELHTVAEAAALLRLTQKSIRNMLRDGRLTNATPTLGVVRLRASDLAPFLGRRAV